MCGSAHNIDTERSFGYPKFMGNDSQYLSRLRDYYASYHVLPSYAGIGKLVGLRSKASVAEMVNRLKEKGFLESAPDRRLRPGRKFFEYPIAESVSAGQPDPATDTVSGLLTINDYMVSNPSQTMLVKVKGDSMIEAGIHDGDIVVVDTAKPANTGEIVVAIIDGEFTLKRLASVKGKTVLKPENRNYQTISPNIELEIYGVVAGLLRKY